MCIFSVHVQSICDAVDIPHFEISPTMDASRFNLQQSSTTNRSVIDHQPQQPQSSRLASLNVYPRQEDINTAFKDLVLYREWKRVAILYTGLRDGDGSGASALHLQHLLIHSGVDCLTRRLPDNFEVRIGYIFPGFFHRNTEVISNSRSIYVIGH